MSRLMLVATIIAIVLIVAGSVTVADDAKKLQELLRNAPFWEELIARDGRIYQPGATMPYTGWVKIRYGNEGLALCHFKTGLRHGTSTSWYSDGQKRAEHTYLAGELSGLSTNWFENGQKMQQGNYRNGKLQGLWIFWDPEGNETERITYENGVRRDQ